MTSGNDSFNYDPNKLRQMISDGKTAKDITSDLKISAHMLMEQLMMLQELDRKVYLITGLFDLYPDEKSIYRKEGILFHKEILEKIGFKPGDTFEMKASGNRITIEIIEDI